MPDSFGKRQRRDAKAKKAVSREERRVARAQRREDRAAGLIEAGTPLGPPEQSEFLPDPAMAAAEAAAEAETETEAAAERDQA